MGVILGTGGDDCVDLCATLFRVCGRYGARAQNHPHATILPLGGESVVASSPSRVKNNNLDR